MTNTHSNLETAFAGESQAHVKYRYFAKVCRAAGELELAEHFERTAEQEVLHAWAHLELLHSNLTPQECLRLAIEGETYEYTTMYPEFAKQAEQEQNIIELQEMLWQSQESREHALQFINLAKKRFSALVRVERKHADEYTKFVD